MAEPLRIGILGAARIAGDGIVDPARALGHRLVAVAARDRPRAEEFATEYGVERVVDDYAALITDPKVDVVYDALINSAHAEWNTAALQAGKHVLSEKPITANAAEAHALAAVAATSTGRIVEGFHYLHHPVVQRLREIVTGGELGELREMMITLQIPAPPDTDPRWSVALAGGATMDLGCYVLNAARHLGHWIGSAPRLVGASAEDHAPGVDARMSVLVEYAGGLPGRLSWDMAAAERSMVWTVVGTAGTATLPAFAVPHLDNRILLALPTGVREETHGDQTSYTYQLAALAAALRTDGPFLVDVADAVANMELVDGCYRAAGREPRGSLSHSYTAVMSYASSRELRPGRMRFEDISPRAYEHPADRGALVALRAIPGFDTVLKAISGAVGERSVRLLYLATSVRTSARQYPELHRMVAECATALDLHPIPELYVTQDPKPDALTIGMDKPIIVVTTGMLQLIDTEGLRFVIGHEVGHVLSGHAVYRTMLIQLISISQSVQWVPVGAWGLRVMILALHEWFRKSELSADRAGLLCTQDPQSALKVHAAMAGALNPDDMDVAGFLDQAKEYQSSRDVRDSVLKLMQISGQTHPMAALRAAELQQWAAGSEYRDILAGTYPRRTDDKNAPMGEDVRAAASSYSKAFTTSADPLFGLIGKVGTAAGMVGGAAANRIRDWWQSGGRSSGSDL